MLFSEHILSSKLDSTDVVWGCHYSSSCESVLKGLYIIIINILPVYRSWDPQICHHYAHSRACGSWCHVHTLLCRWADRCSSLQGHEYQQIHVAPATLCSQCWMTPTCDVVGVVEAVPVELAWFWLRCWRTCLLFSWFSDWVCNPLMGPVLTTWLRSKQRVLTLMHRLCTMSKNNFWLSHRNHQTTWRSMDEYVTSLHS